MTRLFIALEIPQIITTQLAMIRGGITGARWIESPDFHITLRFLGEVGTVQQDRIIEDLSRISAGSIEVRIHGIDFFGQKRPRSIYAGVEENPPLVHLHIQIERHMQHLGFEHQHRKFTPHITLARLRTSPHADIGHFCTHYNLMVDHTFTATGFALYSARSSIGGGPYVVEERFELFD